MDHPSLTAEETAIVEGIRAELSARLLRAQLPEDRWSYVVLGVVVDLAGQVLTLRAHDTESPAPLCDQWRIDKTRIDQPRLHCTLSGGHVPPCLFEAWPP